MARIRYKLAQVDVVSLGKIFERFKGFLAPHRGRLAVSGLSLVGASVMTLLQPWPLKIVFDYVLLPDPIRKGGVTFLSVDWSPMMLLWGSAVAILILAALKGLFTYTYNVQSRVIGHNVVAQLRLRLFSHVQRLPQSYHDYRETGELMTRLTGDLNLVRDLLVSTPIVLASQFLLVVGMMAVMFWIDWSLALIALAVMPAFTLAAFKFSGKIKTSARRQREAYGKIVTAVQESLSGISQVKGFAQERRREKMVGKSVDRDAKANVHTTRLTENYGRTVELINAAAMCAVLLVGSYRALAGQITAGDVLIVLSYLRSMYRPLRGLARLTARMAKATVRAEKVMEILDIEPEAHDRADAVSARNIAGEIEFKNVNFAYGEGGVTLRDVSCHVPANRTTLIVGPTGAGKSTLAKLMLRLYECDSGTITMDGRDIRDYSIASLRKRVTPLTQEAFLFRTTVADNIAFGARRATLEQIVDAARLVGADQFIRELPEGYDTWVGESGSTLSGGQRQRICFARAVVRQSPVLILDEPVTGLDIHAEAETKGLLSSVANDRTLIVVTHRLHFLDLADWVVLVEDGTVVCEGPPQELIMTNGSFQQFVEGSGGENQVAASRP